METMGVMPTMPMTTDNDGFSNGGWFWIILILLFAGGGFGFGNRDNAMSDEFIKRDIFSTNQNLTEQVFGSQKEILENRYTTQLGLQGLQTSLDACCCSTQRAIDSVKAEGYKNTCEITNAIHSEAEATRALINAQTVQNLRDKLADRDRELMTANFQLSQQAQSANLIDTLIPRPVPSYPSCSPYVAYTGYAGGCGCGNI